MTADCIFCKIIEGKIPAKRVYEDAEMIVIHDVNPQAPVHVLAVPKRHIENISGMSDADGAVIGQLVLRTRQVARQQGWESYRLVFNDGREAGQSVFHIQMHLLSGRRLAWPPG